MGGSIHVSVFSPADELDGPEEGAAVALRFRYSAGLVSLVKGVLHEMRPPRSPPVGGWSAASRRWWVRSKAWPAVRGQLLGQGVDLWGPNAHPRRRRPCSGLWPAEQEEEREWDAGEGRWLWPRRRGRR
jgi:hypothetical protein